MGKFTPEKRKKMEKVISDFFGAADKTGSNKKKYNAMFSAMSDAQFTSFFNDFVKEEDAVLPIEVVDYEHSLVLEDIERALKVINVPLFEDVYMPHITLDKTRVVRTKTPVIVGYDVIKRTQQTVAKKNGISASIDKRSAITAQVTGSDKNGRESDLENTMLVSMGMTNTLRELNGPRADDMVMKNDMTRDIALNGYVSINDLTDNIENKTTLNTVDTYLYGMGLSSDLVTKGLMNKKTLREEL